MWESGERLNRNAQSFKKHEKYEIPREMIDSQQNSTNLLVYCGKQFLKIYYKTATGKSKYSLINWLLIPITLLNIDLIIYIQLQFQID